MWSSKRSACHASSPPLAANVTASATTTSKFFFNLVVLFTNVYIYIRVNRSSTTTTTPHGGEKQQGGWQEWAKQRNTSFQVGLKYVFFMPFLSFLLMFLLDIGLLLLRHATNIATD